MSVGSRRKPEQVFRARGLRKPAREGITQDRLSGARPLPSTVNHDDTTKASSAGTANAVEKETASGIASQAVQIDPLLRFVVAATESEELCVADAGSRSQSGLVWIGPAKTKGRCAGWRSGRNDRFARFSFDSSRSAVDRPGITHEVGEALRLLALLLAVAADTHFAALLAARAEISSVKPRRAIALRVGPACARSSRVFG
jgi:hypothetical protein